MMSASAFKIDSPFAKFGTGGQLTCTLCNTYVKSAKVWIAHVNGRQHRENLATRNAKKAQPQQPQKPSLTKSGQVSLKRPVPVDKSNGQELEIAKRVKTAPTATATRPAPAIPSSSKTSATSRSLVQAASDSESESTTSDHSDAKPDVSSAGLPADFFDASTSSSADAKQETNDVAMSEAAKFIDATRQKSGELPEGFFDDRKTDAKVRGVELKDPLDEEWSKFQKEMQKVEVVSEQIIEEDEDHMALERDLDEVEEQLREWSRINQLEKRKEAMTEPVIHDSTSADKEEVSSNKGSTDDELDDISLENVLDWRSKDVWK